MVRSPSTDARANQTCRARKGPKRCKYLSLKCAKARSILSELARVVTLQFDSGNGLLRRSPRSGTADLCDVCFSSASSHLSISLPDRKVGQARRNSATEPFTLEVRLCPVEENFRGTDGKWKGGTLPRPHRAKFTVTIPSSPGQPRATPVHED